MRTGPVTRWAVFGSMMALVPASAAETWPDAVETIKLGQQKAEACVTVLKRYGSPQQVDLGRIRYAQAKGDDDAIVSGLIVALAVDGTPEGLTDLQSKLQDSMTELGQFCDGATLLIPSGTKGIIDEFAKAAIGPVIDAIARAIGAIYNRKGHDDDAMRQAIKRELEAARWPKFEDVSPHSP